MSGQTATFRPAGQTLALSVVATSHAAVPVVLNNSSEVANWIAFLNLGTVAVAVKLSVAGSAATLPVDGTPGDFLLPPLMTVPVAIPLPNQTQSSPCQITAIGATAGPSIIYATPVVMQH